jgi:hypothetical protein
MTYTSFKLQFQGSFNAIALTKLAIFIGLSSKSCYRLAKTQAVQIGINNKWLEAQGLVSVKEQWVKFHYPNG